eukprot:RCo025681
MRPLSNGSCSGSCAEVLGGLSAIANNARAVLPQAVVVWASSVDVAVRVIAAAKTQWASSPGIVYLCPSIVGDSFRSLLSNVADVSNVFVSQVVPPVTYTSHPLVARYLNAMQLYGSSAQPSMLSFEGYVSARLAITVLQSTSAAAIRDRTAF